MASMLNCVYWVAIVGGCFPLSMVGLRLLWMAKRSQFAGAVMRWLALVEAWGIIATALILAVTCIIAMVLTDKCVNVDGSVEGTCQLAQYDPYVYGGLLAAAICFVPAIIAMAVRTFRMITRDGMRSGRED